MSKPLTIDEIAEALALSEVGHPKEFKYPDEWSEEERIEMRRRAKWIKRRLGI